MSFKLAIVITLALVASSQVKAQADFEALYSKLFAPDAPVLAYEENLSLLEELNKLGKTPDKSYERIQREKLAEQLDKLGKVPEKPHEMMEILKVLIEGAKVITERGCEPQHFLDKYRFLFYELNENIRAFVDANIKKQLDLCRAGWVKDVEAMDPAVKESLDKYSKFAPVGTNWFYKGNLAKLAEEMIREEVLAKHGAIHLSIRILDKQFIKEIKALAKNCEVAIDTMMKHGQVFPWVSYSYMKPLLDGDEFVWEWLNKGYICSHFAADLFEAPQGGLNKFEQMILKNFHKNLKHKFGLKLIERFDSFSLKTLE